MNLEKIFIIVGVLIYVIFATSVFFFFYLYLAMYFFKMHCAIYFSF